MKKFTEVLAWGFGLITLIANFYPAKMEQSLLLFGFVMLKSFTFEIIVFFIGYKVYEKWNYIKPHINESAIYYKSFDLKKKIIHSLILIVLVIFIFNNFYYIAKARIYHCKNYISAYKFNLYQNLCEEINKGEYSIANAKCSYIGKEFPEDVSGLNEISNILKERVQLANLYDSNSKNLGTNVLKKINIVEYQNLITSFVMMPNNTNRMKLDKYFQFLKESIKKSSNYFDLLKSKDFDNASKIEEEYGWFIFEDFFLDKVKERNKDELGKYSIIFQFMNTKSKGEFIEEIVKRWNIFEVEKLIRWYPQVKLGDRPLPKMQDRIHDMDELDEENIMNPELEEN